MTAPAALRSSRQRYRAFVEKYRQRKLDDHTETGTLPTPAEEKEPAGSPKRREYPRVPTLVVATPRRPFPSSFVLSLSVAGLKMILPLFMRFIVDRQTGDTSRLFQREAASNLGLHCHRHVRFHLLIEIGGKIRGLKEAAKPGDEGVKKRGHRWLMAIVAACARCCRARDRESFAEAEMSERHSSLPGPVAHSRSVARIKRSN